MPDLWLPAVRESFRTHKLLADRSAQQADGAAFFRRPADGFNSVAVVLRHVGGNLLSRWSDPFTTDGEKPTRDRDAEFDDWPGTRDELLAFWNSGWAALLGVLDAATDAMRGGRCTSAVSRTPLPPRWRGRWRTRRTTSARSRSCRG